MAFTFSQRPDGQVDVHVESDGYWLNQALADSVSSLPPRGAEGFGPSTYWIDVALAGLENALVTGSDRAFTGGNETLLRLRRGRVDARSAFDSDEMDGEFVDVEQFRTILLEWRRRILATAATATSRLPETYRRNP